MNNYEKIKNLSLNDMAKFLSQGLNCVMYGTVDCDKCFLSTKNFKSLCLYDAKDRDKVNMKNYYLLKETEDE